MRCHLVLSLLASVVAATAAPEPAATPATPTPAPAAVTPAPPVALESAAVVNPATAPTAPAAVAVAEKGRITFSQCHVDGPYIAITFDDGPNAATTPRLLKMLKERDIKATFFLVGQCVAAEPDVARLIVAEGHEVASHSWSHPQLTKMKEEAVRDQLQRTHDVIKQETGVAPTLMRPPFGAFSNAQRAWAYGVWGYKCILWDVDSLDWKHRTPAKTQSIILATTKPGSIILCHDIHKTTVDAMPATLDALKAKGFKFLTVTELIKLHHEKPADETSKPQKPARTLTAKEAAGAATSLEELEKQTRPHQAAEEKPPKARPVKTPAGKPPKRAEK